MTVADLIIELQTMTPNKEVWCVHPEGGCFKLTVSPFFGACIEPDIHIEDKDISDFPRFVDVIMLEVP